MGIENSLNAKDIFMYISVAGGVSIMAYVGYHELRKLVTRYMQKKENISDKSELVKRVVNLEGRASFDDEREDITHNYWMSGVPIVGEIIEIPKRVKRVLIHLIRHRKPKHLRVYQRQESDIVGVRVELVYDEGLITYHLTKKPSEVLDLPQSINFLARRGYVIFQM